MKVRGSILCVTLCLSGCYQGINWDASPDPIGAGDTEDGSTGDDSAASGGAGSTGGDEPGDPEPDPEPDPDPDATGGDAPEAGTDAEEPISFVADVWPMLEERCSCHGHVAGGLLMVDGTVYAKIVAVPSQDTELALIEPGRPQDSYLFRKLVGDHLDYGGEGAIMPPGVAQLTEAELDLVERWILQGAAE